MSATHLHSIKASLLSATRYMTERGIDDPRADAELLLAYVLGMTREKLVTDDRAALAESIRARFNRMVARRADLREPVAYIVGSAGFHALEFAVTPAVLIPRPATETLVDLALKRLPPGGRLADIGTGSGAIAIAMLVDAPAARAVATDIEPRALQVAQHNAEKHGVANRLELREGDLLAPIKGEAFDLVLANPPYVAETDLPSLAPELRHEPRRALAAGRDGFAVIERLAAGAAALAPRLLMEIGAGQAAHTRELLLRGGFRAVQFHDDLEGIDRVAEATR